MSDRTEPVRIGSGSGFWGDWPQAPIDQARKGSIDYLVMDYLAEVTMSILQKLKSRDPQQGYARDFLRVVDELMPEIERGELTILSNAGGVNPTACKNEILKIGEAHGVSDLRVAVVEGDDVLRTMNELMKSGQEQFTHLDTDEPFKKIDASLQSAHAYLGSSPILEALEKDADIVVTGRVIDAGLTVAPLAYEFDWNLDDHDKIASATVAGHLIECGGQVSGGNFTDWEEVDSLETLGFPVVEAYSDGAFDITKHANTGGLIDERTVKEQLIYEIRDPSAYLTADVSADFTSLSIQKIGQDRVRIQDVEGDPPPDFYKVSATFKNGYKLDAQLTYSWPKPLKKASDAADILKKRAAQLELDIDDLRFDFVGFNACHEEQLTEQDLQESKENEIQLRISARGQNENDLNRFGKEVPPLILTGPPGATGFAGGRPKARPLISFWPTLIHKSHCEPQVRISDLQ